MAKTCRVDVCGGEEKLPRSLTARACDDITERGRGRRGPVGRAGATEGGGRPAGVSVDMDVGANVPRPPAPAQAAAAVFPRSAARRTLICLINPKRSDEGLIFLIWRDKHSVRPRRCTHVRASSSAGSERASSERAGVRTSEAMHARYA